MKRLPLGFALLALLPGMGIACSPVMSPEFHLGASEAIRPSAGIGVRQVHFVAAMGDSGSCDGVGFLTIELSGWPVALKKHGFIIRARSGVNDERFFPEHPLEALKDDEGRWAVRWAWTGISPDPDGHVRRKLELVPVSRSGMHGRPIPICAASDGSCVEKPRGGT